jgi:hypothetical protein
VPGFIWIIAAVILGGASGSDRAREAETKSPAADGPKPAGPKPPGQPREVGSAVAAPSMAEYKVVFWFDGTTWRSQAYDLRKGEYTAAVDDWVKRIEFDAFGFVRPGPMATVRKISLPESPVESLRERLAGAIRDELERTLRGKPGPPGRRVASPVSIDNAPGPRGHLAPRRPARGTMLTPGASRVGPFNPPRPLPSPYPFPYP